MLDYTDKNTIILYILDVLQAVNNNHNKLQPMIIALLIITSISIIIGIAILWNQRKIKKQLRQLLEQTKATNEEEE